MSSSPENLSRRQFIRLASLFGGAALLASCAPTPFPIENQTPEDLESFIEMGDYERFIVSVGVQKLANRVDFGQIDDRVRNELRESFQFWTQTLPDLPSYKESRYMTVQEVEKVQEVMSEHFGEIFFRMESSEIPVFRSLAEANKKIPLQPVSFLRQFPSQSVLPDKSMMGTKVDVTAERKLQTGIYFNIECDERLPNIRIPVAYLHELAHIAYVNKVIQTYYNISKSTDGEIPVELEEALYTSYTRNFFEAWAYWNQAQFLDYLISIDSRYSEGFGPVERTVLDGRQEIGKDPTIPQDNKFWYKSPWYDKVSYWF